MTASPSIEAGTGLLAGSAHMLIDGELVGSSNGATFDVYHPPTEEVVGQASDGTKADLDRAIAAARRAFDETEWSRDVDFRRHCLLQLRDALVEEKERLRRIIVTEVGAPILLTKTIQLEYPIEEIAYWAEYAKKFEYFQDKGVHDGLGTRDRRFQQYDAVGVVAAITPWNVPLYLNIAECAPALAAGNTVVLKPAELTPWAGTELARLVAEKTDFPPGVFNVVTANNREIPSHLTKDRRVDMIAFTGSTATGRAVLAAAAPTVKKVFLELGGKSSHIFLDDADFAATLPMAAFMICNNAGQGCTLSSRVLLPRSRYDEGIEILKTALESVQYGDVWDPSAFMGAQSSGTQRDKILGLVADGIDSGARLVTGGKRPEHLPRGFWVEPTLLADVDPTSRVAQEEIFGPVITAIAFDDDDEAVAISNNTIYGLSGDVTSASEERALNVAKRMRTGTLNVNGGSSFGLTSPLGGYGQSGIGRRSGPEGFEEYLEIKTIGLPALS